MSHASPGVTRTHRHIDRDGLELPSETPWLGHMARTLGRYRNAILLSLTAVALACLLGSIAAYLLQPTHRVNTMEFRLDFQGAERGQYPNGTRFSTADITSTPVLMSVYNANDLKRFTSFTEFSRSVYILETNRALERLFLEYQTKLADPKLTPPDRERLEREYQLKRESVVRSEFSINYATLTAAGSVPRSLADKTLNDILAAWANYAAKEKGALNYAMPVVTENILDPRMLQSDDLIIAADILRTRINTILRNIEELLRIPGASVLRTKKENISLFEISVRLTDTLRFKVSPLLIRARSAGAVTPGTIAFLQSQLTHNERTGATSAARAQALRDSLNLYMKREQNSDDRSSLTTPQPQGMQQNNGQGRDVVMPQINESFIDRLLELSTHDRDFEYRQELVDRITTEALRTLPFDSEAVHYRDLLESVRQGGAPGGGDPADPAFRAQLQSIFDDARTGVGQVNEIYRLLSEGLNPPTVLFTVTRPPMRRVERDLPPGRLALYSALIFGASVPVIILACLLHNRIREEEDLEDELNADEAAV
ncbi:MAG TPA: hypothetical protein VEU30_07500 [Thermoanaerobaculia bacterium]|nr:hypothetical protein [Thermoanaerobaculia bacterium]